MSRIVFVPASSQQLDPVWIHHQPPIPFIPHNVTISESEDAA